MRTLINLSPKALEFLDKKAREWFGDSTYKRSAAIERLIAEYEKRQEMKDFKEEVKKDLEEFKDERH